MRRQRGAVMVMAVLLLGVAVLAWQHRASLSQLILAQASLDQATSAAALGAAQWHARVMNAHAMLNRTEMAHQVAMAHLMTLASAWRMREVLAKSANIRNPPPTLIGSFFGAGHADAYRSARQGFDAKAMKDLQQAFERHDKLLKSRLAQARQNLLHQLSHRTKLIVKEVLRRNLASNLSVELDLNVDVIDAGGLPARVVPIQDSYRWQAWMDAVIDRHEYLDSRADRATAASPYYPQCLWFKHVLARRGFTTISVDGHWYAEDSLGFHKVLPLIKFCYYREYPMGYADFKASTPHESKSPRPTYEHPADDPERPMIPVPENFKEISVREFVTKFGGGILSLLYPDGNGISRALGLADRVTWTRTARPVPYELRYGQATPVVTVRVRLPRAILRDSRTRVRFAQPGMLDAQRDDWPGQLRSSASAKVEYDRFDGKPQADTERFRLLQPFWVARQVPVPAALSSIGRWAR